MSEGQENLLQLAKPFKSEAQLRREARRRLRRNVRLRLKQGFYEELPENYRQPHWKTDV